jgi:hypothetical protein
MAFLGQLLELPLKGGQLVLEVGELTAEGVDFAF